MSKSILVSSYGFEDLKIAGLPETAAELDQLAGKEGAALDLATNYYIAHIWLSKFRKLLTEKLEASTGVARQKEGKKFTEGEGAYVKRLEAQFGEALWTDHRKAADEAASEVEVNFARAAREAAASTASVAKKYLEAAQEILTQGKVEKFLAKYAPEIEANDIVDGNAFTADGQTILANVYKKVTLEAERKAREAAAAAVAAL